MMIFHGRAQVPNGCTSAFAHRVSVSLSYLSPWSLCHICPVSPLIVSPTICTRNWDLFWGFAKDSMTWQIQKCTFATALSTRTDEPIKHSGFSKACGIMLPSLGGWWLFVMFRIVQEAKHHTLVTQHLFFQHIFNTLHVSIGCINMYQRLMDLRRCSTNGSQLTAAIKGWLSRYVTKVQMWGFLGCSDGHSDCKGTKSK